MSRASLLVIDDDSAIRPTLHGLSSQRYWCHTAASAEEALGRLSSEHYDVIIFDIPLPGMSGLELLTRIRRERPGAQLIFVTGIDDEQHAGDLCRAGAFDYLCKPFQLEPAAFARAISTLRGRGVAAAALAGAPDSRGAQ